MSGIAFIPDRPSKRRPGDLRGAFEPAAVAWQKRYGGPIVRIQGSLTDDEKVKVITAAIGLHAPDAILFACHGLPDSLPQMGIHGSLIRPRPNDTVHLVAAACVRATTTPRIFLAACSTGDDTTKGPKGPPGGDGGLGDSWRDSMVKYGATLPRVWGHQRAGEAASNPYLRIFEGAEDKARIGGRWLVVPPGIEGHDHALWKTWAAWLDAGGWIDLPFLSDVELRTHLEAFA